jgi:hypothetical protein
MDEGEEYNSGTFATYDEAVAKCKEILNDFLEDAYQKNDTPESLYATYVMYGETPVIWGKELGTFNSNEYAKEQCNIIIEHRKPKIKKFIRDIDSETKNTPFLLKPAEGETIEQFKARVKRALIRTRK